MVTEESVVTLIGSGTLESKTPMLFSTHSVNQTLLWLTVKSNNCATPQSDKVPQSDQLGFLDGITYSTSNWVDGSYTPRLFATCSLNHSLPLASKWAQYGLDIGVLIIPDALRYEDTGGGDVMCFVNFLLAGSK